jgi:hypothetical protein
VTWLIASAVAKILIRIAFITTTAAGRANSDSSGPPLPALEKTGTKRRFDETPATQLPNLALANAAAGRRRSVHPDKLARGGESTLKASQPDVNKGSM